MSKILDIIQSCKDCPHRHYYSGGVYECSKVGEQLVPGVLIPRWCPLPEHPAHHIRELEATIARLQALSTKAT